MSKTTFMLVIVLSGPVMPGTHVQPQEIKVKMEKGIQVVYNPKKPCPRPGTPHQLIVTEDLCIGNEEGDEDFILSQIRSVQVDEDDHIFVLDSKEVCVKEFDNEGKHIRTFGRKGQGPGEMQSPTRMHIAPGRQLLIYDPANNRISFYSLEGEFLKEIPVGKSRFSRAIPDSKGNIITQQDVFGDDLRYVIGKVDADLKPLLEIASIQQEIGVPGELNMLAPTLNVRVMKNDNIVWGYSLSYEIFVVSPEGQTIRKIVKDYDPVKITEEEKERLIDQSFGNRGRPPGIKLKFPKNYFPYYFCICGDDGKLYVRTY